MLKTIFLNTLCVLGGIHITKKADFIIKKKEHTHFPGSLMPGNLPCLGQAIVVVVKYLHAFYCIDITWSRPVVGR